MNLFSGHDLGQHALIVEKTTEADWIHGNRGNFKEHPDLISVGKFSREQFMELNLDFISAV